MYEKITSLPPCAYFDLTKSIAEATETLKFMEETKETLRRKQADIDSQTEKIAFLRTRDKTEVPCTATFPNSTFQQRFKILLQDLHGLFSSAYTDYNEERDEISNLARRQIAVEMFQSYQKNIPNAHHLRVEIEQLLGSADFKEKAEPVPPEVIKLQARMFRKIKALSLDADMSSVRHELLQLRWHKCVDPSGENIGVFTVDTIPDSGRAFFDYRDVKTKHLNFGQMRDLTISPVLQEDEMEAMHGNNNGMTGGMTKVFIIDMHKLEYLLSDEHEIQRKIRLPIDVFNYEQLDVLHGYPDRTLSVRVSDSGESLVELQRACEDENLVFHKTGKEAGGRSISGIITHADRANSVVLKATDNRAQLADQNAKCVNTFTYIRDEQPASDVLSIGATIGYCPRSIGSAQLTVCFGPHFKTYKATISFIEEQHKKGFRGTVVIQANILEVNGKNHCPLMARIDATAEDGIKIIAEDSQYTDISFVETSQSDEPSDAKE